VIHGDRRRGNIIIPELGSSGRSSSSSSETSGPKNPKDPSSVVALGSPGSSATDQDSPTGLAVAAEKLVTKPLIAAGRGRSGNLRTVESWPTAATTTSPAAAAAAAAGAPPRLRSWSGNLGNLRGGFGNSSSALQQGAAAAAGGWSKETATTHKAAAAETPRAGSSGMLMATGLVSGVLGTGSKETVRSAAAAATGGTPRASQAAGTPRASAAAGTTGRASAATAHETTTTTTRASAAAGHETMCRGNIFAVGESLLIKRTLSSSDPEEVKKVGNEQYKKGNFAEALSLYDRAILLAPGHAPYHSNRAAALTALSRLPEAVRECEYAIKINSLYLRAHQRLASLCLRLGRLGDAKKHLQIPGQNIDVGEMLRVEKVEKHLENCYNARNALDWNAVVRECNAAVTAGADSAPQLFALKAEAFLKLHRYEEADIVLSAAKKIEGALRKSTSMQADTQTLLVQAQVDMALGRFEGAVIAAEKAAYFDPQNAEALPTLKRARAVALARTTGNDLYKAGKFLEASVAYSEGLQYDPSNAILLCNRAACRSKLGHYEKAVEDCNAALDAQPHYTKALLRRAHSYSEMKKWDLSLKDFEALRKEMPGNTDVARALSEVQVAMKNSKGRGVGTEEKQQQQRLGVEVNVCSNDQLREEISNHGIAVVQFNTRWSEGCRQMASVVEKLCKLNPTVNFLKVDTEASPYLAKAENVDFVPTFKIYKNGVKVMELPGPTEQALENALSQLCRYY
jgi:tetratricopeptide (TPR) repeat protein